jgi:hypothetical protein
LRSQTGNIGGTLARHLVALGHQTAGLDIDNLGSAPRLVKAAGCTIWSPERIGSDSRSCRGRSTSRPRWRASSRGASTASSPTIRIGSLAVEA